MITAHGGCDDVPTFGSLFAGIGGIDLGLERAGWTGRWQVEYEPFCQRVLAKHWPDIPRYGDIKDVDWSQVEPVDLVAGGFPCQPFSNAGRRLGVEDDRWLWPEFARAIGALRPRYVLVENVPGLLAGHGGMGYVLGDLAALGYDADWDCLPASAFGAPHVRDRVWIVAHANGDGPQEREHVAGAGQPSSGREQARGALVRVPASQGIADAKRGQRPLGRAAGRMGWFDQPLPRNRDWPLTAEPVLGRGVDGVPARVDRLRALGNAVVPQVVEFIGRRILEAEAELTA